MLLPHRNARLTAILVTVSTFSITAATASGFSSGNGGNQPPAQYSSPLPTLTNGQSTQEQTDSSGRLLVSPSSFPSVQPVSLPSTVPVTPATPFPVYPAPSASPFTVNVNDFPATQFVAPAASSSAFNVNCLSGCSGGGSSSSAGAQYNTIFPTYTNGQNVVPQYDSSGRAIISPIQSPFPVNVNNLPSTQLVAPAASSSAFPVTCISGCSGGSSSSSLTGQYNSTLPNLSSGSSSAFQFDANGLLLLSPQNNIQSGGGIYQANPPPLAWIL